MRIAVHDYAGHPFQFELSRTLAERGHTVRHFFFADDPGPKGSNSVTASDPESFSITPISLNFPYNRESLPRRFVGDILYAHAVRREIKSFEPDVVVSGNAPLHAQAAIKRAAAACGAKFVFWVQDLHGLAIERVLRNRWFGLGAVIAKYYVAVERRLLARSSSIVVISPDFRKHLPKSAGVAEKTEVIMNWGPMKEIGPREKVNPWSLRHGLADKFVFMYTGTLGLKHNPETLWALSEAFASEPDVVIAVAATGASATQLRSWQERAPRPNLKLLPLQPMEDFPDVLGCADVVMALLEADSGEFSVPSKILSYLCAGRPILLSAPSDNLATRMLRDSGAGIVVTDGGTEAFIAAARGIRDDPDARSTYGSAGRAYAESHFDIERIASRFELVFARRDIPPVELKAARFTRRAL